MFLNSFYLEEGNVELILLKYTRSTLAALIIYKFSASQIWCYGIFQNKSLKFLIFSWSLEYCALAQFIVRTHDNLAILATLYLLRLLVIFCF